MIAGVIIVASWLLQFANAQLQPCVAVQGDQILAGELTAALPGFAKLAPETPIGPSPQPGVQRVFRALEWSTLAKRFRLEVDPATELCVTRVMESLDRTRLLEAMKAALAIPGARIDIINFSAYQVPRGRIEFRREGLHVPSSALSTNPVEWRGNVIFGENRRFSIWARVVVSAPMPRVLAVDNLARGEPIRPDQIRVELVEAFPEFGDLARSTDQVVGLVPWRTIAKSGEIHMAQLSIPLDVGRGEMVDVEVRSGAARLSLTAKAESGGRSGDFINLRNPSSNRVFQARVNGKGKAVVDAGHAQRN